MSNYYICSLDAKTCLDNTSKQMYVHLYGTALVDAIRCRRMEMYVGTQHDGVHDLDYILVVDPDNMLLTMLTLACNECQQILPTNFSSDIRARLHG